MMASDKGVISQTASDLPYGVTDSDLPSSAMAPEISVVLTVYNTEHCLPECLDSILSQSFGDFELICVDDGSPDRSREVLESYAARDSRVIVVARENGGAAAARNAGMAMVRGRYLICLDSDDVFDASMFQKLHDKAASLDADVVVCSSCEFDGQSGQRHPTPWALKLNHVPQDMTFSYRDCKGCLFETFMGWAWDKLIKTDLVRAHSLVFPDLPNSEDLLFAYSALLYAQRIAVVEDVLVFHRVNRTDSVSGSRLKSPRSFYDAIVLMKDRLAVEGLLNGTMEWGFLSWALDYTLWNILTLPSGGARDGLIADLFEGRMPALELDTHVIEYYALYGTNATSYLRLQREYRGEPDPDAECERKHRGFLDLVIAGCRSLQVRGFSGTVRRIFRRSHPDDRDS